MIAARHEFASRDDLATQLASDVAAVLERGIAAKGKATLAVSGGTTPSLFFERLSRMDIAWTGVTITLVDERQVPETSERSNARLVRTKLLQNNAASARFMPLYDASAAAQLDPLDTVVLGMGLDGHTASFLPGGDRLAEALDPDAAQHIVAIHAPGASEPRLTLTLPVLLAADFITLHIEGPEKRAILDAALADGPIEAMPIRAFLRAKTPMLVYWCP